MDLRTFVSLVPLGLAGPTPLAFRSCVLPVVASARYDSFWVLLNGMFLFINVTGGS